MRETFGGSPDQIACVGQRHMSMEYEFQRRRVGATKPGKSNERLQAEVQATRVVAAPSNFRARGPQHSRWERLGTLILAPVRRARTRRRYPPLRGQMAGNGSSKLSIGAGRPAALHRIDRDPGPR
jgi:hypothetical protein